jgi:hypothetical protein
LGIKADSLREEAAREKAAAELLAALLAKRQEDRDQAVAAATRRK